MLYGMPLVILNMGGEMLYILEQRLQAQKIPKDKSVRVLQDVIRTMFSEKFISELFKPQKMYTDTSIRQVFDKLAHSSIMRLNASSMSKLYDLMTMGTKFQILTSTYPLEVAQLTLNHLDNLKKLITAADVIALIDNAIKQLLQIMTSFTTGDHAVLRWSLCRLLQDRRVKVSLFLQEGIQLADGTVVINHKGVLPPGGEAPGKIRYFDDDGKVIKEDSASGLKNTGDVSPAKTPPFDLATPNQNRHCTLGGNLYAMERRKGDHMATHEKGSIPLQKGSDFEAKEEDKAAAKAMLNSLAAMIGGGKAESDNFDVLNLFPDTQLGGGGGSGSGGNATAEVITFDDQDQAGYKGILDKLGAELDGLGLDDGGDDDGDDDDLLALMDGA